MQGAVDEYRCDLDSWGQHTLRGSRRATSRKASTAGALAPWPRRSAGNTVRPLGRVRR